MLASVGTTRLVSTAGPDGSPIDLCSARVLHMGARKLPRLVSAARHCSVPVRAVSVLQDEEKDAKRTGCVESMGRGNADRSSDGVRSTYALRSAQFCVTNAFVMRVGIVAPRAAGPPLLALHPHPRKPPDRSASLISSPRAREPRLPSGCWPGAEAGRLGGGSAAGSVWLVPYRLLPAARHSSFLIRHPPCIHRRRRSRRQSVSRDQRGGPRGQATKLWGIPPRRPRPCSVEMANGWEWTRPDDDLEVLPQIRTISS